MFSRIEFLITETFLSLRRHPGMAFAAVACVAAALFVSGIVGLVVLFADNLVNQTMDRVRMAVYFTPETTREESLTAYGQIQQVPGVKAAEFISKEEAWKQLARDKPDFARLIGHNPYPDKVVIQLVDVSNAQTIAEGIQGWAGVSKVVQANEVTGFLEKCRDGIKRFGPMIGILLALISLVIIHHTIELTLYARRKEIFIMSLVGATPSTVALPFLLEGMLYGLIGGVISLGALVLFYDFVAMWVRTNFNAHLAADPLLSHNGIPALLVAGMALGLLGSIASVTKYLHRPRSKMTNA